MEEDSASDNAVVISKEGYDGENESKPAMSDVTTPPTALVANIRRDANISVTENRLDAIPFIKRLVKAKDTVSTTPSMQVTNVPETSPITPSTGRPTDYRKLYHEMRKRVLKLTEDNASDLTMTMAELEKMKTKYAAILLENAKTKENLADHEKKLEDHEAIIVGKDKAMVALTGEKDKLNDMINALKRQNEHLIAERDKLKSTIPTGSKLTRQKSEEMIRTKSKTKKGKGNVEELECEHPDCGNKNEDALIKCNSCGKWMCDSCSDARIAKLKPCINSCTTIFFACRNCVESSQDTAFAINGDITSKKESEGDGNNAPEALVTSMRSLFRDHVSKIETTIENMIEKKLNEKIPTSVVNDASSASSEQQDSYARKVLQVPAEVRKIIQEAKNDDRVEVSEQERRSSNFIIHGAEECGDDIDSMKNLDAEYIDDILKQLGVSQKPDSIVRVGNPNKSNARPIQFKMKAKADKQAVINRLNRLKGI